MMSAVSRNQKNTPSGVRGKQRPCGSCSQCQPGRAVQPCSGCAPAFEDRKNGSGPDSPSVLSWSSGPSSTAQHEPLFVRGGWHGNGAKGGHRHRHGWNRQMWVFHDAWIGLTAWFRNALSRTGAVSGRSDWGQAHPLPPNPAGFRHSWNELAERNKREHPSMCSVGDAYPTKEMP